MTHQMKRGGTAIAVQQIAALFTVVAELVVNQILELSTAAAVAVVVAVRGQLIRC